MAASGEQRRRWRRYWDRQPRTYDRQVGWMDRVLCTFSLCAIPDHRRAVAEMVRVLRPGGRLLLAGHVASTNPVIRGGQRLAELISVPLGGDHVRRRPLDLIPAAGLGIEEHDRFAMGIVERLAARKAS